MILPVSGITLKNPRYAPCLKSWGRPLSIPRRLCENVRCLFYAASLAWKRSLKKNEGKSIEFYHFPRLIKASYTRYLYRQLLSENSQPYFFIENF